MGFYEPSEGPEELAAFLHAEGLEADAELVRSLAAELARLRAENERLRAALEPFADFGEVLAFANRPKGYSWVCLYRGGPNDDYERGGIRAEIEFDKAIPADACIMDVNASILKSGATMCGPTLKAGHFFAADAALATPAREETDRG